MPVRWADARLFPRFVWCQPKSIRHPRQPCWQQTKKWDRPAQSSVCPNLVLIPRGGLLPPLQDSYNLPPLRQTANWQEFQLRRSVIPSISVYTSFASGCSSPLCDTLIESKRGTGPLCESKLGRTDKVRPFFLSYEGLSSLR